MATSANAANAWFGWGKESTAGTAVAIDKWMRCNSIAFDVKHTVYQPPVFGIGPRLTKGGSKWTAGAVSGPFTWTGQEELLELAMGSIATVETEASTRWTHTFKQAATLSAMTAEAANDDISTGSRLGKGVGVNTLTFSQAIDDCTRVSYDLIGQIHGTPVAAASTESFPSDSGPTWDGWVLNVASSAVANIDTFTWSVGNNLVGTGRVPLATARTIRVPARGGPVAVTCQINGEFEDVTELNNYLSATEQEVELVNTGPTLGAGTYKLTLTIPSGFWSSSEQSTTGAGPVGQTLSCITSYNSSDATWGMIDLVNATQTP